MVSMRGRSHSEQASAKPFDEMTTPWLMSLVRGALEYDSYGFGNIVLFGNGKRMKINNPEDLSAIFLDYRVGSLLKCLAPLSGWKSSINSMICLLENPGIQYHMFLNDKNGEEEKNKKIGKEDKKKKKIPKFGEKKSKGVASNKSENRSTFEEFFMKRFNSIGDGLRICEKAGFGRSLFERLVSLGYTKHLLKIQYRMHPSISLFPNTEFYEKHILDGDNVKERNYERCFLKGNMYGSYSFINLTHGKEEFDNGHSRRNMVEVAMVAEIIASLYKGTIL
ncbi:hypothetical protein LguiA_027048 [Lonicera macranthoides]